MQVLCTNSAAHQFLEHHLCLHQSCPAIFAISTRCTAKIVVSRTSLLCTNIVHQSFVQCTGAELSCVHSGVQNASLWWHQLLVQVTVHRPPQAASPDLSFALIKMFFGCHVDVSKCVLSS